MTENNEIKNEQYTSTSLDNMICIGGHIYDIFIKSGINPNCKVEDWKKVEHDIVKYLYSVLGENEPMEELCNFTALINAFSEALVVTSLMESKLEELQNKNK